MRWYELRNAEKRKSNQLVADICVPADSPWFAGHFPGEPILPGVAQLGMVFELIGRFSGRKIEIEGVERVRFKKMIRPGERIRVFAEPRKGRNNSYSFRIMLETELVCSGFMAVKYGLPNNKGELKGCQ